MNCPTGYKSIHSEAIEEGKEYRYRSPFGEAHIVAKFRNESGWYVTILMGRVRIPNEGTLSTGQELFVPDTGRWLFTAKV
jgi:hypothetical protein